ncbi:MAG TPA: hypothetical protein VFB82_14640 [Blastocatellia bacterium]|nr:hypothetical protein [Blastocatellia bacterium]
MSRLDDELRMAFRREQPPVDFTDRVLAKIARQPAPRVSWWQRLAESLQPPKLKWVAIGATAALLVAIGAAQYAKLHPTMTDDSGKVAVDNKPQAGEAAKDGGSKTTSPIQEVPAPKLAPSPANSRHHIVAVSNRAPRRTPHTDRVVNPEAEAAKEKVMLALHITSTTLNDAQRAIADDEEKPQRSR